MHFAHTSAPWHHMQWNKRLPVIPPFPACFPLPPSPSSSLLRHHNLPQALHLSGLSACFFIWLVATGGSTLADYNSAASHFRFIRAPLHFSLPHSLPSPDTQQYLITSQPNMPPALSHPPLLISAENLAHTPQDKKILWRWKDLS